MARRAPERDGAVEPGVRVYLIWAHVQVCRVFSLIIWNSIYQPRQAGFKKGKPDRHPLNRGAPGLQLAGEIKSTGTSNAGIEVLRRGWDSFVAGL